MLNVLAIALTALFLAPVYWLLTSSLKSDAEIFRSPPTFFPADLTLEGFISLGDSDFFSHLRNSLIISLSSLVISVCLSIPAAYGLVRFKTMFQRHIVLFFIVTQLLPASLLLTPLFLLYSEMGINDTYLAPIFSTATISIPFVIIFMRPFFASLPRSIEEAARIDGCNVGSAFLRIMLPMSRTGILTASIFSFMFAWNDLAYSMSFIRNTTLWPLTVIINDFQSKYGLRWNSILAFGVSIVIPSLLIFLFMQKYIVSGLTSGGVKE